MTMMNTVMDQVARMDNAELNRVIDAVKLRRTFISQGERTWAVHR